jgi:hypothetical protein
MQFAAFFEFGDPKGKTLENLYFPKIPIHTHSFIKNKRRDEGAI